MHLYYPHHDNNSTWCERFFSPPRSNCNTNNKYFFSVFYFVIVTFPHIVTLIYWAILVPKQKTELSGEPGMSNPTLRLIYIIFNLSPGNVILDNGWFCKYYIATKYGINSLIAFFELFYLSSIKRPDVSLSYPI
jgi:hypothetical protein